MNPSEQIDELIAEHPDWRGRTLAELRRIILEADPDIEETWKWMGSPVWEKNGIVAVGNIFKSKVKLGFMYGALIPDPDGLFNGELGGNQRRSIELTEGESVDPEQLQSLIRSAIDYNTARKKK